MPDTGADTSPAGLDRRQRPETHAAAGGALRQRLARGARPTACATCRRADELAAEAGRDSASIQRASSLSLDDLDTARRHAEKWRDVGYDYLVCGWPGEGEARVEAFAREVLADFT